MQILFRLSFFFGLCHGLQLNATQYARFGREDPVIMLTSGVSGSKEMCLSARGADVILEPCMNAIAAGDGREIWAFQSGGQLVNVASNKCLGPEPLSAGSTVQMVDCALGAKVEIQANSQLKLGSLCLSQVGSAVGQENIAKNAIASASSTVGDEGHSPDAAIDENAESYWASGFDEKGPVEFLVDLGTKASVDSVFISWEYPAKAFSIALSSDGLQWSEIFETTVNAISSTFVSAGGKPASMMKIVMKEPHSMHGKLDGHSLYGIRKIAISAAKMHSVAEDCSVAAKSADARDKYFPRPVAEYNPLHVTALKSEMPSLEAAIASLSATVNELAGIIPKLSACQGKQASFLSKSAFLKDAGNLSDISEQSSRISSAISAGVDTEIIVQPLLLSASSLVKEVNAALFQS